MRDRYDVVVVGAGSAGSAAAIAAARSGAGVLLVDRLAFMGGTSTAVLDTFYAFYTPGERPLRVVGGLGWEVAQRLTADGVAFERPNTYGAGTGITYDAEALKVLCGAPIEDHGAGGDTTWRYVGEGGEATPEAGEAGGGTSGSTPEAGATTGAGGGSRVYGIPYRTLLPLGAEWLLVAGRCFSATHDAHASARSMATCMAMGQAAGTAAVLAAAGGTVPRAVPVDALRERLALDGALLEPAAVAAGEEAAS